MYRGSDKLKTKARLWFTCARVQLTKEVLGWRRAEGIRVKKGSNFADRLGLLFKPALARIKVDGWASELDRFEVNNLIRTILGAFG